MDLGCLDMGCISVSDKTSGEAVLVSENKEGDESESVMATAKAGKNKVLKETGQSMVNALNKFTSQIKKPPHRKSSPLNWFPRKKVEPYLKRKLKLLQEVDGMNSTLDETLGDSIPHYSRVKREQIAAREAAYKAMEARKAALVEASWCRILRAARIQNKEADALLLKAEKIAAEAFEGARAMKVIMFDIPNCPRKPCEIETSFSVGGGSTTHTVAASFETAFDVDKEVAAAVKTAFTRLANCPSINRDEFKDLLRKISQNPAIGENHQELSSECESDTGSEFESDTQKDHFSAQDLNCAEAGIGKFKKRQHDRNFNMIKLVDMMLERLKCLQEYELESLATIVATCGLNAALAEVENSKQQFGFADDQCSIDGQMRRKYAEPELPSLDKFLVKHLTKLEREVLEAKNTRRNEPRKESGEITDKVDEGKAAKSHNIPSAETIPNLESILVKHYSKLEREIEEAKKNSGKLFEKEHKELEPMSVPDLGSILIKHSSKLEREIEETKRNCGKTYEMIGKRSGRVPSAEVPSLDKLLVKHVSRLEREVQEAKNKRKNDPTEGGRVAGSKKRPTQLEGSASLSSSDLAQVEKENIDLNKDFDGKIQIDKSCSAQDENSGSKETEISLDKILVKPVHRLEREKMQALSSGSDFGISRHQKKQIGSNVTDCESLDKVLVKHVSRLEKEKLMISSNEYMVKVKRSDLNMQPEKIEEGGLGQNFVIHKSRLEREKMAAAAQQPVGGSDFGTSRHHKKQLGSNVSDCESLDNVLVKHVSRLEKEKMMINSNEDMVKVNMQPENIAEGGLDQIFVKHKSRLEREKMAAVGQQPEDQ